MSNITRSEVERLAKLARIGLSESETGALAGELEAIVGFVEQLQSVDIENLPPTDQVTGLQSVMRPDEVVPSLPREELLANAPRQEDGYIVVRRVMQ